jgi:chromosome segregation ATPase
LSARVAELEAERNALATSLAELRQELEAANGRELEAQRLLVVSTAEKVAKDEELEAAHEWTSRALAQEKALRDLAESLSRDLAAGADECAKLQENYQAAELREQQAVVRALEAESAYASSLVEIAEWKTLAAELGAQKVVLEQELEHERAVLRQLRTKLNDGEQELTHTRERLEDAEHERERFLAIIERVAALSHEILEVGLEARTLTHEPEHERVTLVPGRPTGPAPRPQTDSTAPEILVDGVELGSTFTKS